MDSSQDCCYTQAGQGQDSGEVVTSALPQALPYVWTSHAIERCAYIAQQLQIQAKFCKNCGVCMSCSSAPLSSITLLIDLSSIHQPQRVFCHLQGLSHGTDLYFFIPEKQHVCYLELGLHDGSHSLALGSSTRLGLLNNLSHSGSFARSTIGSRSLKEQLHAIVSKVKFHRSICLSAPHPSSKSVIKWRSTTISNENAIRISAERIGIQYLQLSWSTEFIASSHYFNVASH
ncbi:hypothetical protein DFJ43DRAFT_175786 [Lentinula guzmanii]|uniref:Uncharacterized protein n=1 Tax=Lentinula guzmanii TaxID=2804957 RepID=A0AA38N340_9AGAR|nr:hypothetical protein DFJ43DRAFT_175786 [Lentinula guzmanii]